MPALENNVVRRGPVNPDVSWKQVESEADMAKYSVFVLFSALYFVPHSVLASDTYAVRLVSVWTNKTALGGDSESIQFTIDNVVRPNKHPAKVDGKNDGHIDRSKTRYVDLVCLEGKPLGTSFAVQVDTIRDSSRKNIGKVIETLQQEDGELRLSFEMRHGKRTLRLRRRGRIDDKNV